MKLANFSLSETADTKRLLISQIARVYDPYGITAPLYIVAKILLSGAWKEHKP